MLRNDWTVGEHGIRPAGSPDNCFYCGAERGAQHRMGCVIRERSVVVRTIVEHTILVPEDWEKDTIEFTEGSSCSDNHLERLNDMLERMGEINKCSCGMLSIEYVREATEEDEDECATHVADAKS